MRSILKRNARKTKFIIFMPLGEVFIVVTSFRKGTLHDRFKLQRHAENLVPSFSIDTTFRTGRKEMSNTRGGQ